MTSNARVIARRLCREYRVGPSSVHALSDVDLEIATNEFVAVLGRSGSGKSTLLHLLAGLDTPTSGSLVVSDVDLIAASPAERALFRRREIGMIFQSFHLVASRTALENVELALTIQGTYGATRRRLALEALDRVGLAARAAHRPSELSGGEQQRVAVARAIVHRPPLLLADEPTGNLDETTAGEVLELLRGLWRHGGTTVLLVTHDARTAAESAQRTIRFRDGRLTAERDA